MPDELEHLITVFFAPVLAREAAKSFTWNFTTHVAIIERRPTNTNNRDNITEVAEGLSQESAMQRFVFACLVLALMVQGALADASSLNFQSTSGINVGSKVQTTADGLSVRDSYGVDEEKNIKLKLGREIIRGDTGVVTDGPNEEDGYVWWKIKYDFDGTEGWSAERSLENPDVKYLEPESVPKKPENFENWRDKAIDWATKLHQKDPSSETYYKLCLKFVACAFQQKPDGASGYVIPNHELPYALDVAKNLHRFNQEPNGWEKAPYGALIFFDKTASNDAGHIGFKNKDGRLIESYGKIKLDTIINDESFLKRDDVGKYLGWSFPPDTWSPPPEIAFPGQSSEPGENIGDILTPNFKWKKAPNAEYYALYIRKAPFEESNKGPIVFNSESDYGPIKGDIQGSYLAFSLPSKFQLEIGKKYRWNMCAVSNSGSGVRRGHLKSGISDTLYFETSLQGNSQGTVQSLDSNPARTGTTNPFVQSFQVTPQSSIIGESFAIDYTVSDTDGSGLKQVELWRKDETSDWQEIKPPNTLSGETGPVSGLFTDSPTVPGKYWYGVHVVDNAGNWNDEKNSNTKNMPGCYGPVEVEIKEAQTPMSDSAMSWLEKGDILFFDQREIDAAIEAYDTAIELDPQNITLLHEAFRHKGNAWYSLGWFSEWEGDHDNETKAYDEAIKAYDEAIRLDPNDARPWLNKGNVFFHKHVSEVGNTMYDEAIKCYDRAIELNPRNADAWYNKGVTNYWRTLIHKIGTYDDAVMCFDKAIDLNPEDAMAWHGKCRSLREEESNESTLVCDKASDLDSRYDDDRGWRMVPDIKEEFTRWYFESQQ